MANKYASIIEELCGHYSDELLHAPKLSETQLSESEIEEQLGYDLPKDYREFLQDYAGINFVFFVGAHFNLKRDGIQEVASIDIFFGSGIAKGYYATLENLKNYLETEWYPGIKLIKEIPTSDYMGWPEELLPIGGDGCGNQICLALFGQRPHAIFWWRDNPWDDSENLYLIADSFDEFMHLLYKAE